MKTEVEKQRERSARWYEQNKDLQKERMRERSRRLYATPEGRAVHLQQSKETYRRARQKVLEALGSVCKCCGESANEFLAVDHINGQSRIHRQEAGTGYKYWKSLLKDPALLIEFRILCHNCNMARGFYGYCPHQEEK